MCIRCLLRSQHKLLTPYLFYKQGIKYKMSIYCEYPTFEICTLNIPRQAQVMNDGLEMACILVLRAVSIVYAHKGNDLTQNT
jgi:hypothetical protein